MKFVLRFTPDKRHPLLIYSFVHLLSISVWTEMKSPAFLDYFLFIFLIMSINNKAIEMKIIDKTPQYNKYLETKKYTTIEQVKAIRNSLSILFKVIKLK